MRSLSFGEQFVGLTLQPRTTARQQLDDTSNEFTFEMSFWNLADQSRYTSTSIESTFLNDLTGAADNIFPTNNEIFRASYQMSM